jgi:hypothetical protein
MRIERIGFQVCILGLPGNEGWNLANSALPPAPENTPIIVGHSPRVLE